MKEGTLQGLGFVAIITVIGNGLAMMMNYKLLSISTPLFVFFLTLLMPIVAIIWGILDGEKLTAVQTIGAIIILAGLIFLRSKAKS